MSISLLLGKQSSQYSTLPESAYKTYIPGGVQYKSQYYSNGALVPPAPGPGVTPPTVLNGLTNIVGGNVANSRFVRVLYTKIGTQVTIKLEAYGGSTAGFGDLHSQIYSTGGVDLTLTFDALDDGLKNQIINDITQTNPTTSVSAPLVINLIGICGSTTDGLSYLRITAAGNFEILKLAVGNYTANNIQELGAVSFVAANNLIL